MILLAVLITAGLVPLNLLVSVLRDDGRKFGPRIGEHVHAIEAVGAQRVVVGHRGAGVIAADGTFEGLDSIAGLDVTAVSNTEGGVLVLADGELRGTDRLRDPFEPVAGPKGESTFVAMGAADGRIYLATKDGELFVSRSSDGRYRQIRGTEDTLLVGQIDVAPDAPGRLVAIDRERGAVLSTDDGRTWRTVDSPFGDGDEVAAVFGPGESGLTVLGGDEMAVSREPGSWETLDIPPGLDALAYDESLVVAAVDEEQAITFVRDDDEWRAVVKAG
jgi:hypothetical protein